MNLVERMDTLKNRVEKLKSSQSGVNEAKLLQIRLKEIKDISVLLNHQAVRLRIFRKEGSELSEVPSNMDEANKRLSKVRERFTKNRKAENLTKGKDWEIMRNAVQETAATIKGDLSNSWRSFVIQAYSGENPNNIKNILAPTDSNNSALVRYRNGYEKLNELARNVPDSKDNFEDVRSQGIQLKAIYKEFDFDVPVEVKVFLDAVGSGGAGLELLTDKVHDWLSDNDTEVHYKIVANR